MFKVLILGAAHKHIFSITRYAQACPGSSLLGVYDADAELRQSAAERLQIPAFDTVDQALAAKPDLVLIAAVPCERAKLASQALAHGAAALVDKPLAVTHQALGGLMSDVERYGKRVITYLPYRGDPRVRAAKAALKAGRIGQLVQVAYFGPLSMKADSRPDWHWRRADNGGILIDIGTHGMDLCCWIAENDPAWISAVHCNFSKPEYPEFQDFAQAQIRFASGQFAHMQVDWLAQKGSQTRLSIQGTRGNIEVALGGDGFARLCTAESNLEELDISRFPAAGEWLSQLIEDLALGRPCQIGQEETFRACRATLWAFDSAQAQGAPVKPPPVSAK